MDLTSFLMGRSTAEGGGSIPTTTFNVQVDIGTNITILYLDETGIAHQQDCTGPESLSLTVASNAVVVIAGSEDLLNEDTTTGAEAGVFLSDGNNGYYMLVPLYDSTSIRVWDNGIQEGILYFGLPKSNYMVGETATITLQTNPATLASKAQFFSDNDSIADINSTTGDVNFVGSGTTTLYVYIADDDSEYYDSFEVNVSSFQLSLDKSTYTLGWIDFPIETTVLSDVLTATVSGNGNHPYELEWFAENSSLSVTPQSNNKALVQVAAQEGGSRGECTITCKATLTDTGAQETATCKYMLENIELPK